jgi:hypothetical protein
VGLDRAGTMAAGSRVDLVNFGNNLATKLAGMVVAARWTRSRQSPLLPASPAYAPFG